MHKQKGSHHPFKKSLVTVESGNFSRFSTGTFYFVFKYFQFSNIQLTFAHLSKLTILI